MFEQIAEAIKSKDYRQAAQLLSPLRKQQPDNPWVQLYVGLVYEGTKHWSNAEKTYRQLLKATTNPKIITQARKGLGRLQKIEQESRKQAIAEALAAPKGSDPGVLVLEPIIPALKLEAAKSFAKIMEMDAYTARLQIPSQGWRLYRTGKLGELNYYVSCLQKADIKCFCTSLLTLETINIYQVRYFQSLEKEANFCYQDSQGNLKTLSFHWSEISKRVEGLVPLFDSVVDTDARRNLQRKTQTLDYVQFCDLHLPEKQTILRLSDRHYEFQQGTSFASNGRTSPALGQGTIRKNWNNLMNLINQKLPHTLVWSDFTYFAETALEFPEMLKRVKSNIELFRREETPWDAAFQLYSCLVFFKQ
ncbi:MAG: tetratricopeptide repeat protein [Spirulinaceae cyanobacterium]